ncbi:hypothetical protein GHT06_007188 [Daphnia sinensis]|uniref:Uncharacterized protein n=1 Tax=Daphnia sinensis TaxID=1820382 RepID=A0AAD5PJR7_9CRUS|nr:hypothetical protein GHT06_007188 [Daphnia sinensis]
MTFFVVKIIESNEIVVVPVHWYQFNDNKCAWPIKDAQNRAERKEVFSTRWPRYIAKVISSHEEGGIYANVSLSDLNKLSAEFVTKAVAGKNRYVVCLFCCNRQEKLHICDIKTIQLETKTSTEHCVFNSTDLWNNRQVSKNNYKTYENTLLIVVLAMPKPL